MRASAFIALHAPLESRFPFRSAAAIERAKLARLRRVVEFAWRHVPYYGETMRRLGLSPSDIRTERDLAKLPILERDQLQRDPEYFVSTAQPIESLIAIRSSGTTGSPRACFRDIGSVARDAVHFTRVLEPAARLVGKRRIKLKQASILPPMSSAGTLQEAYRSISLFPAKSGVENARLSLLDPVEENLVHLNRLRPDVIFTFGSYLEALFVHMNAEGERLQKPAALIYSADGLSDSVRELISERFGLHVLSAYLTSEMPHIGFECELHRGLHLNTDLYPLRILDRDGEEAAVGEGGEVVVSNLVNRGTVLLNYRLGDLARKLPEPCACGRNLPMMSLVEGRSEDWLITGPGRSIHPQAISMWLGHLPEILRYQVVQETPTSFTMTVVADPDCDRAAMRSLLQRKFSDALGDGVTLAVSFADSLPRSSTGKVRPVISRVRP